MTPEPSLDTPNPPSDIKDMPAERRSWAPPAGPGDTFASPPLRKRAIGWRGGLRGRS